MWSRGTALVPPVSQQPSTRRNICRTTFRRTPMRALMMETPLLVSDLIRHADRHHGDTQIVSRRVEGDIHRYTYRESHARSRRLANALARLGLKPGDRVHASGTTGNPKRPLYSHRSSVLHAYAICLPDAMGLCARDCALPVVPMFHANAWGLPFAAPMVGAKIVFPGCGLDGKSLHELFENERVTFSAGVPTVWGGLIQYMKENGVRLTTLKRTIIGGAACPPAMIRTLEDDFGIEVNHAWGMTEMSPLGSVCKVQEKHLRMPVDDQRRIREKQGHVVFGVDWKIVDGEGKELPWDGEAFGDLLVRGPWVVSGYYKGTKSTLVDGWFPTGDVATIDPDGYLKITDRSKDVVKSGGEWISSIALENLAMAHPAVQEAAVIACRHPKWDERPLLVVVKKPKAELTREELLAFYEGKVATWGIPDD